MGEKEYMNRGEKIIEVSLEVFENKDVMVFNLQQPIRVSLNDDDSQNNLKKVFVEILSLMMKHKVILSYKDNSDYKTRLYIDVCQEYIKELNREIDDVDRYIPEEINITNGEELS